MSVARSIVSSVVRSVASSVTGEGGGAAGSEPVELIGFGDMSADTGWNLNGWVIAGGTATSPGDSSILWRELEIPTVNGADYVASLNIVTNDSGVLVIMQAFNGDPAAPDAFQSVIANAGTGMVSIPFTANAVYSRVRIRGVITADVVVVDDASILTD